MQKCRDSVYNIKISLLFSVHEMRSVFMYRNKTPSNIIHICVSSEYMTTSTDHDLQSKVGSLINNSKTTENQ